VNYIKHNRIDTALMLLSSLHVHARPHTDKPTHEYRVAKHVARARNVVLVVGRRQPLRPCVRRYARSRHLMMVAVIITVRGGKGYI